MQLAGDVSRDRSPGVNDLVDYVLGESAAGSQFGPRHAVGLHVLLKDAAGMNGDVRAIAVPPGGIMDLQECLAHGRDCNQNRGLSCV